MAMCGPLAHGSSKTAGQVLKSQEVAQETAQQDDGKGLQPSVGSVCRRGPLRGLWPWKRRSRAELKPWCKICPLRSCNNEVNPAHLLTTLAHRHGQRGHS